ncbi:multidrug resistance protein homolog 65 isoform X2 [Eurosta solidaginis]|uniref:multidrug resistance protein homolog 65 isoform X2 n=1 Tax=Eurosta solidaginis TaxID=178769 RepID=UPI0035309A90
MDDKEDKDYQASTVLDDTSDTSDNDSKKTLQFFKLYRFSTAFENVLLFIGFFMSIIKALTLPAVVIVYSEFTAMLVDRTMMIGTNSKTYALPLFGGGKILTNATREENMSELYNDSLSYGLLLAIASIIMLITGVISVDIFNLVALQQVTRMRKILFETVMRQDIAWHDMATKQNFTQQLIDDVEKVRDGISEKVGHFLYLVFGFIITVAISFAYGWKLTLAVSVYIPVVIILNYFVGKYQSNLTKREQESYAGAGNIVEEVFTYVRTVVAFGAEKKESERYDNYLVPARKASQRKGAFSGVSDGVLKSMLFLSCAGAFWYGVNLIIDNRNLEDKEYTPAILMIAFFGIIVGADNIARTAPFLESFSTARGSATNIFKVIDTKSKIDPLSSDGKILNYGLRGEIEFKDVFFRYPSRPDVIVQRGINFKVCEGQTVALVGASGCGKSTCIQLLQRFYDPIFGTITLDGLDIRKYNIHWLRSNMAVVGQEPVLFQGTIEITLNSFEKSFETDLINMEKNHIPHKLPNIKVKSKENNTSKDDVESGGNFFVTFQRILKIARPEWCMLFLGAVCAIAFGFTYPAFSVIFGEFYAALSQPDEKVALQRTSVLSIYCLILGVLTGIGAFLQTYLFNYAGVWLTTRMRSMTFTAIMHQEAGWFDEEGNSVGSLSARLTGDASGVQGAIGYPLSGLLQASSNFVIALTLSLYYSWKLALVCLCACPIIVGSIIFESKFMSASLIDEKIALEEASRIATEAITNIRTIAGLRREAQTIDRYNLEIDKVKSMIKQKLKYRGLINASGQSFIFFAYAVALCYGGVLVSEGKVPFQDIIKVSETLLYGSMMLAQSLAFAPAFTAALVSAHRLFQILDRTPKIQSARKRGANIPKKGLTQFEGVRFTNIEFKYPTRTDDTILNGLNLEVPKGKTVALVGRSGCGKSTCIQLLMRLYDPDSGTIKLNDEDIHNDISIEGLRRRLGLVSQEPSLFDRTIAENIAYGDNSRKVTMDDIIAAAKCANAHNFIITLPNGYDTRLGARGTQLSGGQKQRIAIARALVRNPKILLLDEATSALDLQSEQLVQQALDVACAGRTCIVIAHRLSTVQNADVICVLENGRIAEIGNHQQLIQLNGIYAKLYKMQPREQ